MVKTISSYKFLKIFNYKLNCALYSLDFSILLFMNFNSDWNAKPFEKKGVKISTIVSLKLFVMKFPTRVLSKKVVGQGNGVLLSAVKKRILQLINVWKTNSRSMIL